MTTKKTTTKAMKKAEKVEAAHPAVLLDECGVTIVGVAPQLEWKDVISVANDKFDPSVKGMYFDAIRFTVRGGLKFCVRKEDVVWAENKEVVDTEDIRGMPRCTDETCVQLGVDHDCNYLHGNGRIIPSKNLMWSISFGDTIRGKGLALKICEESLIYEIAARLNGETRDDKSDFRLWLKPLEQQMRNIMKDGFASKKDATEVERKAIVAAYLSVSSRFEDDATGDNFRLADGLGSYDNESAEYKKLQSAADRKEMSLMRLAYDAFRNACAWSDDENKGRDEIIMSLAKFPTAVIACSDLPTDFSMLAGVGIPNTTIMLKRDIAYYDELKFPEGHPKEGGIYVQDAKDKNVYTELTETNTGKFSKKEVKEILAKLKKILPDVK